MQARSRIVDGACNHYFIYAGGVYEIRKTGTYGIRRTNEGAAEETIDMLLHMRWQGLDRIHRRCKTAAAAGDDSDHHLLQ